MNRIVPPLLKERLLLPIYFDWPAKFPLPTTRKQEVGDEVRHHRLNPSGERYVCCIIQP